MNQDNKLGQYYKVNNGIIRTMVTWRGRVKCPTCNGGSYDSCYNNDKDGKSTREMIRVCTTCHVPMVEVD